MVQRLAVSPEYTPIFPRRDWPDHPYYGLGYHVTHPGAVADDRVHSDDGPAGLPVGGREGRRQGQKVKQKCATWKRTHPFTFWYIIAVIAVTVGIHFLNDLLASQSFTDIFWR